jgi:hypothetical protein
VLYEDILPGSSLDYSDNVARNVVNLKSISTETIFSNTTNLVAKAFISAYSVYLNSNGTAAADTQSGNVTLKFYIGFTIMSSSAIRCKATA